MRKANERQVGGAHYRQDYQHWDFAADTPLNYFEANITKYITRWRSKDGVNDVKKAAHYLQKLIELYQQGRMTLPERPRLFFPLERFMGNRANNANCAKCGALSWYDIHNLERVTLSGAHAFVPPIGTYTDELEGQIYRAIVFYTSLPQLVAVRDLVETLLGEAEKVTK